MTEIRWVNHASFIVEHGPTRLICDPWLTGTAFDDGWAHISESAEVDWAGITHIWISHEHPDHFSPRDLVRIPEALRHTITVLYQPTKDKKVIDWCQSKGFQVLETPHAALKLADRFSIHAEPWKDGDSFAFFTIDGVTILNLNDCVLRDDDAEEITATVGVDRVDILLSQFSYANWQGNPEDRDLRRASADEKLQRLADQVRILSPAHVIPFASFVWFCHDENRWMNDEAVTVERAAEHLAALGTCPVVLYPGDEWDLSSQWAGNRRALDRYAHDLSAVEHRPSLSSKSVHPKELEDLGNAFVRGMRELNGDWPLKLLRWMRYLEPTAIWVTDHARSYVLSLDGFRSTANGGCDIALSSEALAFCFRNLFGGSTLMVNGRFTVPGGGSLHRFMRWMETSNRNNQGDSAARALPSIARKSARRLAARALRPLRS